MSGAKNVNIKMRVARVCAILDIQLRPPLLAWLHMNKPKLVLTALNGVLRGECSSCPESVFSIDIEPYDQASYDRAFRLHLKHAHNESMRPAGRSMIPVTHY